MQALRGALKGGSLDAADLAGGSLSARRAYLRGGTVMMALAGRLALQRS